MKKKVLASLLCVAMAAATLVGCGSSPAPATETPAAEATPAATDDESEGALHFEIVSKGFQHQYWQAVKKGADEKAAELGVTINFVGPDSESNYDQQLQQLNSAINATPAAIGLAALDTQTCMEAIQSAMDSGIPIIGFDSGVPDAPEGSIWANCATDNYAAGAMAAEETYKLIKDTIASASGPVRIGVLSQDAVSESVVNRGLGFVDKMGELLVADGKTVNVEGNDRFKSDSKVEKTDGADVVIEVLVPAKVDSAMSATDCQTLLSKEDTICIYGSNQHSAEAMVTGDENFGRLGKDVVGVGFDSGVVIKGAVESGQFAGAITQAPVAMGAAVVEQLYSAATTGKATSVDTGCQWYTKDNMNDPEIAQNLYD